MNEAPKALSIHIDEPVEGSFVVALAGELDLASATEVSQGLAGLPLRAGGTVVIDVSGLSFVDSSGLNAFVAGSRNVASREASLIVAAASDHLGRLFDVVRLGDSVELASSVEEALAKADETISDDVGR